MQFLYLWDGCRRHIRNWWTRLNLASTAFKSCITKNGRYFQDFSKPLDSLRHPIWIVWQYSWKVTRIQTMDLHFSPDQYLVWTDIRKRTLLAWWHFSSTPQQARISLGFVDCCFGHVSALGYCPRECSCRWTFCRVQLDQTICCKGHLHEGLASHPR